MHIMILPHCSIDCFLVLLNKGMDMKNNLEPLFSTFEKQSIAIENLVDLGLSCVEKLGEINEYASIAAVDNSIHHLSVLAKSRDVDEMLELQIKSLVPALESAKAYAGQIFNLSDAASRNFGKFVESQIHNN